MVRRSATWQLASIVGPVLGGVLYAVDITLPFVAVVGFLLLAAVAMFAVRPLPPERDRGPDVEVDAAADAAADREAIKAEAMLEAGVEMSEGAVIATAAGAGRMSEAMEGLRFIREQPVLLGAISLDLFAVLFGGAVALLPAIAEDRLHVGAVGLGWLRAAIGIGAALVTILLAWRPVARHVGSKLLVAVAVFGVFTIVLGVTTQLRHRVRRVARAVGRRRGQRVHPRHPGAARHAQRDAWPGARGRERVHRRVERARRVRVRRRRPALRHRCPRSSSVARPRSRSPAIWWKVFPALRKVDRFPGS